MSRRTHLLPVLVVFFFSYSSVFAQNFIVGDRTTQVTNTNINPGGLAAGSTVSFQGNIVVSGIGPAGAAVFIDPVASGLSLTFQASSTVTSVMEVGVYIDDPFDGSFNNLGTISAFSDGVGFNDVFSGTFSNSGTITSTIFDGVFFDDDMDGSFTNTGTIIGGQDGVDIDGDLNGTFINRGTIMGLQSGEEGVEIEGILAGTFINHGTIHGADDGLDIQTRVTGSILNYGTISGEDDGIDIDGNLGVNARLFNYGTIEGEFAGLDIDRNLNGVVTNYGSISGRVEDGINVGRDVEVNGAINNYGSIQGGDFGIHIDRNLIGSIFNCGVIEGSLAGIRSFDTSGTIRNHGGRIQGGNNAIRLGMGDGTVILSGPSHIVGGIGGGGGNDTIRFENMRGITDAKKAELAAIDAANPATSSVVLFGEIIEWQNIEEIEADTASLSSYSSLITGAGLQDYASALDSIQGLNDDFRSFLKALNDVDAALLNDIANNSSGRNVLNAFNDFARRQDTRIYSLFADHFSTLRGGVSGRPGPVAGVQQSGLFSREVQAGGSWGVEQPDYDSFVLGYVGSGDQDPNSRRPDSDYKATTLLMGRGTQVTENWYFGGFAGYSYDDGRIDRFGSILEDRTLYGGLNAQYVNGSFFANFLAAYGFHDTKSLRRDFIGNSTVGDPEGHQGLFYLQTGWDHFFGEKQKGKATPYVGMALSSLSQSGFTERGSPGTNLRFADDDISSVQSVVGVNISGYRDTSFGWVRPKIDAAWWHAFDNSGSRRVSLATPGLMNAFDVFTADANGNRAVVQIGAEFACDSIEDWTFNTGYFGTFGGDGYSSHGLTLGAKMEF